MRETQQFIDIETFVQRLYHVPVGKTPKRVLKLTSVRIDEHGNVVACKGTYNAGAPERQRFF
jgi:hypothetical protein